MSYGTQHSAHHHIERDRTPASLPSEHSRHEEVTRLNALVISELELMKGLFRDGSRMESMQIGPARQEGARAGAEFEIYVLDGDTLSPSRGAERLMDALGGPSWLVKEAARCVVEVNAPPCLLSGNNLRELEDWFAERLSELRSVPGFQIYLGGAAPTLEQKHLIDPSFFTEGERYQELASKLSEKHGGREAKIYLPSGDAVVQVKALRLMASGIFCGIQPHLQLSSYRFVDQYNAAVVSSPLHLAMNANSHALGIRGWLVEARLELLKQGVDDERYPLGLSTGEHAREPWDPFQDALNFDPLFTHSTTQIDPHLMPNLTRRSSEIWRRVRACWGVSKQAEGHVYSARTEHRVTGMQPTPIDSIANMALQYGLTLYLLNLKEQHGFDFAQAMPNRTAERELEAASLYGPAATLRFPVVQEGSGDGAHIEMIQAPAARIMARILPDISNSLLEVGVAESDVDRCIGQLGRSEGFGVIAGRVAARAGSGVCPSQVSQQVSFAEELEYQRNNIPVHLWSKEK